jgi:hypothetical protein
MEIYEKEYQPNRITTFYTCEQGKASESIFLKKAIENKSNFNPRKNNKATA